MLAARVSGQHGAAGDLGVAPKSRPVLLWAAVGVGFTALGAYVIGRWLFNLPPRVEPGPSEVPLFMRIFVRGFEVGFVSLVVLSAYWFVIRPWRRERHITWDGLAFLAAITVIWQDYALNWAQTVNVYNAYAFNRGSWYGYFPGWMAPNPDRFIEALLITPPFYPIFFAVFSIWMCFLLRQIRQRWPHLSNLRLFGCLLLLTYALDLTVEVLWARTGVNVWTAEVPGPVLFRGHYYQFPLYETFAWGSMWAGVAALRFFRNDKGESLVERGLANVQLGPRSKTLIRFFAIAAAYNILLALYNFAWMPVALHVKQWPEDIQKRSYFTFVCGPSTEYACPARGIPLPKPGSSYITPSGELRHGPHWTQPTPIPFME